MLKTVYQMLKKTVCVLAASAVALNVEVNTSIPAIVGDTGGWGTSTHYGNPFTASCLSDEVNITITGLEGSVCSPQCKAGACPSDKPSDISATPTCALQDAQGTQYCCLICAPAGIIRDQKAADGACGNNASCRPISGVGVCTYNPPS